ncbi:MAG: T9SS type A sorting domain-containing protein [Ignavibacteria bacterium]|nr:T9SS type A sorting domain-containing protein [Ignavibacteria bacterium]
MEKSTFLFVLLVLHITLNIDNSFSQTGWFSQPLPVSGQVQDLKFFDANTGLIALYNSNNILRTTNGGYNWYSVLITPVAWEFVIIDSNTIYASGAGLSNSAVLLRSYNRGATWDSLPVSNALTANGISFVNRDTGWVGGTANALPFIWRTTNAGLTWTVQSDDTGFGKLFFLKYKVNGEYIGWSMNHDALWKTTNSGINWVQIQSGFSISKILFRNENTGYVSDANKFKKTTNGGLNWISYNLPTGNYIFWNLISSFKFVTGDTIYGDKGYRLFPNNVQRGIIWVSTNGGVNWGFQQPDTSLHNGQYHNIDFIDINTGWSAGYLMLIRTNDGGGPIITTGINNHITTKPELFILEQNFPNPFNSSTRINFSVSKPSYVSLTVYDITGKEVLKIFNNEFFTPGYYFAGIDIGKTGAASGVYIYNMKAVDSKGSVSFEQVRKCVYLK